MTSIFANDYCLFIVYYIHERVTQVVKYTYHQITDFYNPKTKAITASIDNVAFVLLQFLEGTDKICEMIESFQNLS